jgi:hypothetical protein
MVRADCADGQPFTRCTLAAARDADSIAPRGDRPATNVICSPGASMANRLLASVHGVHEWR